MRLFSVLLLVLALGLASCGGSSSHRSTVSSAPGPTGITGSSPEPKSKRGSPAGSKPAGGTSTASPRKISFLEKSFFGALSQVTYFVQRKGSGSALAQVKDCVRQNLAKAPSAYCYTFPSKRAFRFSRISHRPPADMRRACWSAYWGKPKGRPPLGRGSNPAASALRCPDANR